MKKIDSETKRGLYKVFQKLDIKLLNDLYEAIKVKIIDIDREKETTYLEPNNEYRTNLQHNLDERRHALIDIQIQIGMALDLLCEEE